MREPNERLQRLADSYCDEAGLARPVRGHYVPLDTQRAERIAVEYERLPRILTYPDDIPVRAAYDALVRETRAQYLHLVTNGLQIEPWTHAGQPYADSAAMCADLREHRHLYYYVGGEYHTYLGTANLLLRAVHDAFGHAAEGYQFGPRGEENAWIHHSMMFTPLAQRALTTETRGQTSWVNYGSSLVGAHQMLPPAERPYATQKCALLPAWCWDWRGALGASGRGRYCTICGETDIYGTNCTCSHAGCRHSGSLCVYDVAPCDICNGWFCMEHLHMDSADCLRCESCTTTGPKSGCERERESTC